MGQLVFDELRFTMESLHTLHRYAALHEAISFSRDQMQETGFVITKLVCTDQLRDATRQYPHVLRCPHTQEGRAWTVNLRAWTAILQVRGMLNRWLGDSPLSNLGLSLITDCLHDILSAGPVGVISAGPVGVIRHRIRVR